MSRGALLAVLLSAPLGLAASESYSQDATAAAETAHRTGRYEEAISAFARIVRRDPASARAARGQVRALSDVGRYSDAEAAARRFIRTVPDSPELWGALGEVLYVQGKRDEAEEAFENAVASDAGGALVARLNLAVLRYERGARAEAMREFARLVDVYYRSRSLSSEALTAVAEAARYLGVESPQLYKEALRALDAAIAADPGNLDPRLKVGELFLEKYNAPDAAASFEDVLAVNPNHPRALLGMARLKRFDGSPEAIELVERSLEVNSELVEARAFLATIKLESEDYEAAAREAERALEVNPSSLEALSVLAATRYLQRDEDGFKAVKDRIHDLNPRYADLQSTLADLSARNRLYRAAVDFARRAVELDSRSWRGYALLGTNQLRIGAIEEGKRNLEIAFDGDPFDIWTKNTLDLLDTFDAYAETVTDRFELVVYDGESDLLSLYLADLAEEAYDRLSRRYRFRPQTPIRVEVLRSHADFSVRTIGLVGMPALGVSFGPVIAMDSPGARAIGEFNWGSTFWHELAHTFHLAISENRVPRWFSEGLAVYEERRARPSWGDDVTPGFLQAYKQGMLLPVARLNDGFTRPAYPTQIVHSYYQASLVCEYIEEQAGAEALLNMLAGFREGMNTSQVFQRVLGTGVDDFSDRFFAYLEERFRVPLAALSAAGQAEHGRARSREQIERRARKLPGDFGAQLSFGRTLYEEGEFAEALLYLERAKELFPEYAGPESPYWYLALIHKRERSLAEAAAELSALTAINERDYRANLELAALLEEMGDFAGAARALERAIYVYPFEMQLHSRLAETYTELERWDGAIRERRAVLALDPVDRAEALYQLALAYYGAGEADRARRTVLQALEGAPGFEKAQDLLLRLHAESGGGGR